MICGLRYITMIINNFYSTAQLKLDTCMAKLMILSVSLGVTRAQLTYYLRAHMSNVTSVTHWIGVS